MHWDGRAGQSHEARTNKAVGEPTKHPVEGVNALGLTMERDLHFKADKALFQYAEAARVHQHIIT